MKAPVRPLSTRWKGKRKFEDLGSPSPTLLASNKLDEAICLICAEYLTDPVTVECGHNFCRVCITRRCEKEETPACPRCGERVQRRAFKINKLLARLLKELESEPGKRRRLDGAVCVEHGEAIAWFCEEDKKPLCEECRGAPAHRSHTVVPRAKAACQAKGETSTSRRNEDGTDQEQEAILTQLSKISDELQDKGVDVTLDPDTANRRLVLSEDRKRVRHGDTLQDLPDTPERFDICLCVLGAERFSGGRRYWEVEVGDKTGWTLGVCRESVSRKGWVTLSPGYGYWVVLLSDGEYEARTSSGAPTLLPVSVRPSRVGIFLDYEAGEVSFYNVTDGSHLFTFTDTFSGTLRPYFSPGHNAGGTNAAPLIICPVPAQAGGNL